MKGEDWSPEEVRRTVKDYFAMLRAELRHEPYLKTDHNAALREHLSGRTKTAVERKHQNISAVLAEMGLPYVAGYVPLRNVQAALRPVVVAAVGAQAELFDTAFHELAQFEPSPQTPLPAADFAVPPKAIARYAPSIGDWRATKGVHRDYVQQEAAARALGEAGEAFVVAFEQRRLRQARRVDLARKVEQVSCTRGDGLGFDVFSFDEEGRDRLIEVKTTRRDRAFPFLVTQREVLRSEHDRERFELYRVFAFGSEAQGVFRLSGVLRESVRLEPAVYRVAGLAGGAE